MHPEVTSDNPGKCPKCGMTLIQKQSDQNEGGGHQHNH
jgi:ssDNA-binding Zn-finger/Zn-ribbon topoisomerase 1